MTRIYFAHGVRRFDTYLFCAWCRAAAGCGPRGRPPKNLLSLVYGGPLWLSAKKIIITSLRPLRSLRENKKPASAARGKASDSRQYMGGVYPHPLCETQCRGGVYPHPPSATKTYSLGCEVSIQRMVSDGCRVRLGRVRGRPKKNLLSLAYGGPLWPSAKKIYDHFFASFAPLREMKKQRAQPVMCECKTN